jgi:cytochrome c551/c552
VNRVNLLTTLVVLGVLTACGGAREGAESPDGEGRAHGTPWSEKTREQKLEWMGLQVLPKMKALFSEYDAERFKDFKCQTCHGADMELVDFKLPNSLFGLTKTDPYNAGKDYDAPMTEFMAKKVVPEMAKLLDTPAYDNATKQGFGCLNCHQAD